MLVCFFADPGRRESLLLMKKYNAPRAIAFMSITYGCALPTQPPIATPWPTAFDASWEECCEGWSEKLQLDWHDRQNISYDWDVRRMSVEHSDFYGAGPGKDYTTPDGTLYFVPSHGDCCCEAWGGNTSRPLLPMTPPNWMQHDSSTFVRVEPVRVIFRGGKLESASVWQMPGASAMNCALRFSRSLS